ncbi:LOW QUALITY PROTEIN: RING-H2 finger protein ATL40 [Arabidopsis lyrata subsp. lyrata]|uniref:LOW QUALITY PROTEIN: RING-H2 finger protein ATL40 n=1 Tax=Arabidopsis lyrata subsp. lyrata TaxID=81972 RepID=UPI000A29C46B|nr:LOW QUALITY PROTEIN: RING-H2 finger protein ATL40 [Arabidopsis lyrata subsp. lyrata]|eukprot:XP_020876045.1 LOW QUALITY PROTEIN: RING-H2 finger protein ATL40 [Arabidopsis lyrata subsp. lyrata]
MRSFPPSHPSPAYIENDTHHHHLHEDFTLMIIVFVLYGIVAIRYVTFNDGSRGTNLSFQRQLPPLQPPMCPRQIEAMIKDIVVDVELCCPICLEDLKKVDDDNGRGDDDKVVVCLSKCHHSFHMKCIFSWLRQSQDCPICRTSVYRGEVTLINNGVGLGDQA